MTTDRSTLQGADAAAPRRPVPCVVISPHLDDGVLGCGCWLAAHPGSVVMTVFAGTPAHSEVQTDWDRHCGFANAAEAVAARRQEDARALGTLHASPLWLHFADSQYGEPPLAEALAQAMATALDAVAPELLLFPLGLFHCDHLLVHAATRRLLLLRPALRRALAYEDVLYRGMHGLLQQRLCAVAAEGCTATPAVPQRAQADPQPDEAPRGPQVVHAEAKATALDAYASQKRAFGPRGWQDAAQPERFWQLAPRDAGAISGDGG